MKKSKDHFSYHLSTLDVAVILIITIHYIHQVIMDSRIT